MDIWACLERCLDVTNHLTAARPLIDVERKSRFNPTKPPDFTHGLAKSIRTGWRVIRLQDTLIGWRFKYPTSPMVHAVPMQSRYHIQSQSLKVKVE